MVLSRYDRHEARPCRCPAQNISVISIILLYNDVIEPPKTHNLVLLHEMCLEIDSLFIKISRACEALNRYKVQPRYPNDMDIQEQDAYKAIEYARSIRDLEAIINMNASKDTRHIEKLEKTFNYMDVEFESVRRADVIWVGCVDYAENNTGESDIGATLKRFQELVEITPIRDKINPDWSASLSINYNRDDKPCGIMFANESYSDSQDGRYDILVQPGGLWLRVKGDDKNAKALLGKDKADLYEFFGALGDAAMENGYVQNPEVNITAEYHCHAEYSTPPHNCYAYIPVLENPI